MVWFAALIIVVLTAPLWLGLAVAAGAVLLVVVAAVAATAVPAVIGASVAEHFGYSSDSGAVWGFLFGLLCFALWRDNKILKARKFEEEHQRSFVAATFLLAPY